MGSQRGDLDGWVMNPLTEKPTCGSPGIPISAINRHFPVEYPPDRGVVNVEHVHDTPGARAHVLISHFPYSMDGLFVSSRFTKCESAVNRRSWAPAEPIGRHGIKRGLLILDNGTNVWNIEMGTGVTWLVRQQIRETLSEPL